MASISTPTSLGGLAELPLMMMAEGFIGEKFFVNIINIE